MVSSAGEPLTPEVIHWFKDSLGVNIYDQYGQTELGMVIANHHALEHPKRWVLLVMPYRAPFCSIGLATSGTGRGRYWNFGT